MMQLTDQQIKNYAPSFFATHPKSDVSDRYAFISTKEISDTLAKAGWFPTYVRETRSNKEENHGFNKHIVRWGHKDFQMGGERIEIVGVNSHNRSSIFKFMAGIFRLVCTNGMISKTSDFGEFRVMHLGDIYDQVQEAIATISGFAGTLAQKVEDYKTIDLSPNERGVFASIAHEYLYADVPAPVTPQDLLKTRRITDARSDLWTTFNVVQENIMKGGLRGRFNEATGKRHRKTRMITNIDKDVKINQALWAMTEKMAELKN